MNHAHLLEPRGDHFHLQELLHPGTRIRVRQLEQLNHLQNDFVETVAHELRSPLANMKVAIQMLQIRLKQKQYLAQGQLEPDISQYLAILQDECDRSILLVEALLDISRLEAGLHPLDLSPIDLTQWLPAIVNPFRSRFIAQQQHLAFDIPADLPPLTTDQTLLSSILSELLNNACKYTPAQETVTLSATATATTLTIRLSNSGVEIPDHKLSRIFDKFYRIAEHDPWKQGGTGLGLAIVKQSADCLNAEVYATSENEVMTFAIEFAIEPDRE